MATKAQKIRLSIFLIATGSLLLLFFIALVGSRFLKSMNAYYIVYENISVTGLEPGAAVKYHGVQVGRVRNLSVRDASSVLIEIQVEQDTPVKQDTQAILSLVGVTGLKYVELIGGTVESEPLPSGSTIVAGESIFDVVTGSAEVLLAKLEQIMNNINNLTSAENVKSITGTFASLERVSSEFALFMEENRGPMTDTINELQDVMKNLNQSTATLDETVTAVRDLVRSEQVRGTVENTYLVSEQVRAAMDSLNLNMTISELHELVANANRLVVNYDYIATRARDNLLGSLRSLEETLINLQEATDVIRENPSVLIRGRQTAGDIVE